MKFVCTEITWADQSLETIIPLSLPIKGGFDVATPVTITQLLLGPVACLIDCEKGSPFQRLIIIKNFDQGLSEVSSAQVPFVFAVHRTNKTIHELTDLDFAFNFLPLLFNQIGQRSENFAKIVLDLLTVESLYSQAVIWERKTKSLNPSPFDSVLDRISEFVYKTCVGANSNPHVRWLLQYLPQEATKVISKVCGNEQIALISRKLRNELYTVLDKEVLLNALRTKSPGLSYAWLMASHTAPKQFKSKLNLLQIAPALTLAVIDPMNLNEVVVESEQTEDIAFFFASQLGLNLATIVPLLNVNESHQTQVLRNQTACKILQSIEPHLLPVMQEQWDRLFDIVEILDRLATNFYRLSEFDLVGFTKRFFSEMSTDYRAGRRPDYAALHTEIEDYLAFCGDEDDLHLGASRLLELAPTCSLVNLLQATSKAEFGKQFKFASIVNQAYRLKISQMVKGIKAVKELNAAFMINGFDDIVLTPNLDFDPITTTFTLLDFHSMSAHRVTVHVAIDGHLSWSVSNPTGEPRLDLIQIALNEAYPALIDPVGYRHAIEYEKSITIDEVGIERPTWLKNWMVQIGSNSLEQTINITGELLIKKVDMKVRGLTKLLPWKRHHFALGHITSK